MKNWFVNANIVGIDDNSGIFGNLRNSQFDQIPGVNIIWDDAYSDKVVNKFDNNYFDFYLPKYRTVIEFDGKQHYEPMEYFGGIESYERLKINDKIKSDYCEENYIDLIRIRYG
jgi:hypothetical protein